MPTDKTRINISVTDETEKILKDLAKRDDVPVATKALELLRKAIELEEDKILSTIATARDKKGTKYISQDKVWAKFMN